MIVLTVKVTGHGTRGPLFEGTVDGQVIVTGTMQPFFSAARVLLERGASPDDVLIMRHAGSSVDALRAKIGVAAKLTVDESGGQRPRFRTWTAPETRAGVLRIDENEEAA
jgi:hypothetical protein